MKIYVFIAIFVRNHFEQYYRNLPKMNGMLISACKRKNHFTSEYSTLGLLNEIQPLGPALLPKSPRQRCTRKLCFKYSFLNSEPKLKKSSRKFVPSCKYHTSLNIKQTSNTNRHGGDKFTFLLIFELDKLLVGREKRSNYPWWILLEGNFLRWKLSGRKLSRG